jgi:tetratricopeptide (TPR) repeat protein
MRFKITLLFMACFALLHALQAQQDSAKYSLQLLAPDLIAAPNIDAEGLAGWFGDAQNVLEVRFSGGKQPERLAAVMATFHQAGPPTVALAAKPALEAAVQQELLGKLQGLATYNTKMFDFTLVIWIQNHDTEIGDFAGLEPKINFPAHLDGDAFGKLDLAGKANALQQLARTELIPLAAYYENKADAAFLGVRAMGEILKDGEYRNGKIESATSRSFDYWRATVEMEQGNQLIPFSKMAMLMAEGQFGFAERYFLLIKLFSSKGSLPALYREELQGKFESYNASLTEEVNAGIALNDAGKYKEAIAHYKALLQIVPKSAWVKYELYYSENALATQNGADPATGWAEAKTGIYAADPLYTMDVHASNGREGYLLFKRMSISELFQDKKTFKQDLVKYADISMILGEYGYAAQLYWLFSLHFDKEVTGDRNVIAYFLYCLHHLGVDGLASNFKGDFEKEFKKIDAKLKKDMESDPMYKSFEKK